MSHIGRCLAQGSSGSEVSNNCILLDSCSTISCAKNNSIVSKVTVIPLEENLRVYSNGGHMEYTMRGILDILPMGIYINGKSMANILSVKEVADYFRVTTDNKEDHVMLVHYSNDKNYRFKERGKGLYYIDVSNPETITLKTNRGETDYYFLLTVNANMEYFNRSEIEGSDRARDLQQLLGWPSYQQSINALIKNLIINWPILSDDVRRSQAIYGTATDILKVKMARKRPKHVDFKLCITIQSKILKYHPELPLHMDFWFIKGHPYFTTITGKVN